MNNRPDRGAGFISNRQRICWECRIRRSIDSAAVLVKGKPAEEKDLSQSDVYSGLQQNMLQTVTAVERYHGIGNGEKELCAMTSLFREELFMM